MDDDIESLTPEMRGILDEIRQLVHLHGWTIRVVHSGAGLRLEFVSPLSPVLIGFGLGSNPVPDVVRKEVLEYIDVQPEFVAVRKARPPRGKRKLLGALRGGAGSYGWSPQVFREVTDLLYEARVITRQEADWLQMVGPAALPGPARG